MATIEEITEVLTDIALPATKADILLHAQEEGATEDVVDDLQTIPDRSYAEMMEVWQSLGAVKIHT